MSKVVLNSGKTVINPFADEKNMESTSSMQAEASAMDNSTEGQCPKCKGSMGTALAAANETVYFCTSCRVSSPLAQ